MTHSSFNYFKRVDLTVKTYENGATSTMTYSFVDKPLKDATTIGTYWPILKNIGEVELAAGKYLPNISFSTFSVDNTIGSFGAYRKFSDVLQRYTPIEQIVTVYVMTTTNDSDGETSWETVCTGLVQSWQATPDEVTFDITTSQFKDKNLTLLASSSVSGMSSIPSSSVGRSVPLLLGIYGAVTPLRISADGATTAKYAYGTAFKSHLENRTDQVNLYSKNRSDTWVQMYTSGMGDSTVFSATHSHALNLFPSVAFDIPSAGINRGPSVAIQIDCKANGTGASSSGSELQVFLLRYNATTHQIVSEEGRARAILSNYNTQNNAGGSFNMVLAWDRIAFVDYEGGKYGYALGWSVTNYTANDLSINNGSSQRVRRFVRDTADSSAATEWKTTNTADNGHNVPRIKLLGPLSASYGTESTANAEGLVYSHVTLNAQTVDSGQALPHWDTFPFALYLVEGPILTSAPSSPGAASPFYIHTITKNLDYDWNGSAFVDGARWDTSRYSSAYTDIYSTATNPRYRYLSGVFEDETKYVDFLEEVCRTSASRVGILSSGKMFMYPWGYPYSVTTHIPASDFLESPAPQWWQEDIGTVVNRVAGNMYKWPFGAGKSYEVTGGSDNDKSGYLYSFDYNSSDSVVATLTLKSRSLYGNRNASDQNHKLLAVKPTNDSIIAGFNGVLAEYLIARYAEPLQWVSFFVPYHKYKTLEMFDTITFSNPAFPNFYGASMDGKEPVGDSGPTNLINGHEWVRAETYRGLVEKKAYILPVGHAPTIRLTVLVLKNYPMDMT